METRDQLLNRYARLKERARKLSAKHKHRLESFERSRTVGYSKCLACNATAWVRLFPLGHQTELEGTALKTPCKHPL